MTIRIGFSKLESCTSFMDIFNLNVKFAKILRHNFEFFDIKKCVICNLGEQ